METLTKKTVSIEFQGIKYALPDDATLEDLLAQLDLPKDGTVRLQATKDGFVLLSQFAIIDNRQFIIDNYKIISRRISLAKTRISITIDGKTAKAIENYYREKVKTAAEKGEAIPKLSNIYEEIIERGWEYKSSAKKKQEKQKAP